MARPSSCQEGACQQWKTAPPMSYSTQVLGRVSPRVLMCKLVGKFARPRKTRKRVLQREETAFAKTRKVRWTVFGT